MKELFNKITSNGCREMTEARFNEALKEYKQSILSLVDKMIKKEDHSIKQYKESKSNQARIFHWGRLNLLTGLKQKIEAL